MNEVIVFSTSGCEILANDVCRYLVPRLHISFQPTNEILIGETTVSRFPNENLQVQVENVRGKFVVVIHSQTSPVSDNFVELLALLDAICNSNPSDILLIFPYMPYSRSDRKNQPRTSALGCRIPEIISEIFKIRKVILLDPHDSHIKQYFKPTADEISAMYLIADYINKDFFTLFPQEQCVLVFADNGSAKRFEKLPHLIHLPIAYIDKGRLDNEENLQFKKVVGEISGKHCIVIDDEISTGGTSLGDAKILKNEGAKGLYMFAIHPVLMDKKLSETALVQKLEESIIDGFIITDSIPVAKKVESAKKFKILSIAPLLAEAIRRTVENSSLSALHNPKNVHIYKS